MHADQQPPVNGAGAAPADNTTPSPPPVGTPPTKRILVLTHRLPYPPDRGDRIRSYHLLKTLARHFDVALACTTDQPVDDEHRRRLGALASPLAIQRIRPAYSRVRELAALLTGRPLTLASFYRRRLARQIVRWHQSAPFDAVLTFCTGMVGYSRLLPPRGSAGPRHVLDLVDVDSAKWAEYAADSSAPLRWVYAAEATRLRRIEAGQRDHFDAVTVVSRREYDLYRSTVGDHPGLHVVGNGVDTDYFRELPDAGSQTLVFVGVLNYKPNADAVTWFARQVLPLLRERLPKLTFQIVGRHPPARVRELDGASGGPGNPGNPGIPGIPGVPGVPGVEVVGSVPDVRTYLAGAAAVVAPLRIARGVQNKVLEAMSAGRVVVCSPQAAQGVEAVPVEHLLVAADPAQWVDQLERVVTDEAFRQRIATAASEHVRRHYNWAARLNPLVGLLAGQPTDRPPHIAPTPATTASEKING